MKTTIQSKGRHHRLLRDLLFSNYLNVFAFSLFGPLYAVYIHSLGASVLAVSQLLATYALTLGIFLFIFGRVQNQLADKRMLVVIGFFLLASGAFAYLFVHSLPTAYAVQIWNALATAWFLPAWKCIYGRGLEDGRETEGWGKVDGGGQILTAIGVASGGALATVLGFHYLIILVGALQIASGLYSLAIFRHSPP